MPVICGAFEEMNKETHLLIIKCAKHAEANQDISNITPEENSSAKGSPYHLILSHFRRAFGCLAMRTAADEKLRKIMLIRPFRFKANQVANNTARSHRCKFNPRSPGWNHNFRIETFHDALNFFVTLRKDSIGQL